MEKKLTLKIPPKRILVIAMRYLGDLLLTTPLLQTLRDAYPDAQLHVLVFQNTAVMLEGNPHIDQVLTTPMRPTKQEFKRLCKNLFRNYDLAIATETGDRRYVYALLAAPKRVAFVPPKNSKGWWKRFLVHGWTEYDELHTHAVLSILNLATLLNLQPSYQLCPPECSAEKISELLPFPSSYVVLHPHPQWNYKRWPIPAWIQTANFLAESGYTVVLTGGPTQQDLDYVAEIQADLKQPCINLAGQTSLAQLAHVIRNAQLFIGPDTGTTHLAAATGIPVIAIYGPTNPVKWGPWPMGYQQSKNPFHPVGDQQVGNIYLIQGKADCVPCQLEGCERHRQSYSECLDNLSVERIIDVCERILLSGATNQE